MIDREKVCKQFGGYVRAQRRWAGLTQKQLGKEVSLHQAQISRVERGEVCPRLDIIVGLLACLGADPREMLEAID